MSEVPKCLWEMWGHWHWDWNWPPGRLSQRVQWDEEDVDEDDVDDDVGEDDVDDEDQGEDVNDDDEESQSWWWLFCDESHPVMKFVKRWK